MQQPFTPVDDQDCGAGTCGSACGSSFGIAALSSFPSLEDKAADLANIACGLAAKACDTDAMRGDLSNQLCELSKRFIARSNDLLDESDFERLADEEARAREKVLAGGGCGVGDDSQSPIGTDVIFFHRVDVIAEPDFTKVDIFAPLRNRIDLAQRITDVRFFVTDGITTTVCLLTLDYDLSVVGVGSLVQASSYNRTDGMLYSFQDAVNKLLDAEGYAVKRDLLRITQ